MTKIALLSLTTSTLLLAGGYKIPELSINSMALSAAYVANAHGADAAYFNPANMAFEAEGQYIEGALTYIRLASIEYTGTAFNPDGTPNSSGAASKAENFLSPSLHYVSNRYDRFRFGLSVVAPAGLSKRWSMQPAKTYAHEFTLQVVEVNPSMAYRVSEDFAVGAGVRIVHTSGVVKSASIASRDMEGDTFDFGYNLALSYKATPELSLAATYRSNVDLDVEGDAAIYFPDNGNYGGTKLFGKRIDAAVSIPNPAALNLAAAYRFDTGTTVEFVYERTFWSTYESLDFDYEFSLGALDAKFSDPIAKAWNDVSAYRLGLTQEYDGWTGMAAIAYDETPIPEHTVNFELPDSDAIIVSVGGRYAYSDTLSLGTALLIDFKESRTISGSVSDIGLDGKFTDARAYLFTVGAEYKF
ncbi:MAG: aromatic hydrocarbon degradation protein [Sulfurimonas sp.]|nr:MAG: aromatic hydrocarbon degradation protein [Sulfurimonas sp.]